MRNWSFYIIIVVQFFIIILNCESRKLEQSENNPPSAKTVVDTIKNTGNLKSLTIFFEDGQTMEVINPVLKYLTNPGWTPMRYEPTGTIEFIKTTLTRGVKTIDTTRFQFSDIHSIEYLKNKMNECICVLTWRDGKQTLTAQEPARILEKFRPAEIISRKIKVLPELEGFYPGHYQISGLVNGNEFETNTGEFFDCLAVWDDSANRFIDINKIIFNYMP